MKVFLFLLSLALPVFATSINESLLKVHSILVPKLYLMDYQYKGKITNNTIKIAIIYKKSDYQAAKTLENLIHKKYTKGIQSFAIKAFLINYENITNTDANIYYLFPSSESDINKAIGYANGEDALTFSYQSSDLQYGVMISVNVEHKIKPILNLLAIQTSRINLRPVLMRISNIYYD
ncbi:MAG: YfiR/HmsC family protein [Sulfurimonas sp.]|nr:YfiR/HmsC family protein [Sulfurimonas sp.]MDQ7060461.1 YfiR/HmsC family protein [Sulfurimonas sp.]